MIEINPSIQLLRAVELVGKTLKFSQFVTIDNKETLVKEQRVTTIDLAITSIDLEADANGRVNVVFRGTDKAKGEETSLRAPIHCLKAMLDDNPYHTSRYLEGGELASEYFKIANPQVFRIELNDFISKADACVTAIATKKYATLNEAAEAGWRIMLSLAEVYEAEIENQGDQFMVYPKEGTYDPAKDECVFYTLRVLDEDDNACDLD